MLSFFVKFIKSHHCLKPLRKSNSQINYTIKNTLYSIALVSIITGCITSCTKPTVACFDYSPTTTITTTTVVNFDASCTKYGGYTYTWNFGDGTKDTTLLGKETITHLFTQTGSFTVTLMAGRKDGVTFTRSDSYITKKVVTVH